MAELTTSESPKELANSGTVRELVTASVSENTRRAYQHALSRIDKHLAGRQLTDGLLADYIAGLHVSGKSPATCSQVIAAVKFRTRLQGSPSPVGPATDRVLAGIRRAGKGRGRGQVQGVQFAQADAAAAVASDDSLAGLRDSALLAVASDGLLRVSEVAGVQVADISFEFDGTARLTIHQSKTDQEGAGVVLFLGAPTAWRVKTWMDAAGIEDGPVFRRLHRGDRVGKKGLSTVSVRNIIKRRCAAAGIDGDVSGHSLRVGGAQSLAAGGASIAEMQTAGRWTSPQMPGHYARGQLAARGAVARIRYGS